MNNRKTSSRKLLKMGATALAFSLIMASNSQAQVVVSTIAGDGNAAHKDGYQQQSSFNYPRGIALNIDKNLYVTEAVAGYIRKIKPTGMVTSLAGNGNTVGPQNVVDGIGSAAGFSQLRGLANGPDGTLYTFDYHSQYLRKISLAGQVTTIAGCGHQGETDGPFGVGCFYNASAMDVDAAGNIYVLDGWPWSRIRKVSPNGTITTLSLSGDFGGPASSTSPLAGQGITVLPTGVIYVADTSRHQIRRISPSGYVTLVAGSGTAGDSDGQGAAASFDHPNGLDHDSAGNLYVADMRNNKIRKITPSGKVTTIAGAGIAANVDGLAASAQFAAPWDVAVNSTGGVIYVNDQDHRIRKITCKLKIGTLGGGLVMRAPKERAKSRAATTTPPRVIYEDICKPRTVGPIIGRPDVASSIGQKRLKPGRAIFDERAKPLTAEKPSPAKRR